MPPSGQRRNVGAVCANEWHCTVSLRLRLDCPHRTSGGSTLAARNASRASLLLCDVFRDLLEIPQDLRHYLDARGASTPRAHNQAKSAHDPAGFADEKAMPLAAGPWLQLASPPRCATSVLKATPRAPKRAAGGRMVSRCHPPPPERFEGNN